MPVEIKELIIRTTVDSQNSPSNASSNANTDDCARSSSTENNQVQLDEIIKMMKSQNER